MVRGEDTASERSQGVDDWGDGSFFCIVRGPALLCAHSEIIHESNLYTQSASDKSPQSDNIGHAPAPKHFRAFTLGK